MRTEPELTAIIPTLNAAPGLAATLRALAGQVDAIIIADGGSTDATRVIAEAAGARVIETARGRGSQIAAGVAAAATPWLLVIHADTRPGAGWRAAAAAFMADPANAGRAAHFRFALDDASPQARRLERAVAWRCRALGLPYGDQGLLVRRDTLAAVGGFHPIPIMEDVDLVRRLGRARLVGLEADFVTSAARWREEGWLARSARNLSCLALWVLGVPPARIARLYARRR
ncbi:TIGR04283 family arsenosugar biosynthesis glycosyltransferase [Roseomonas rosulenta]|uniref:TIGR04283 family arsenosugar biosynthesis glycosyltransferase n=1 Tax=Roseomonas rosulenta TaxID=2748667 RepID=UPI0018DF9094|nr:TIGR04283 family arsenosugar biosynthesis glycosyltransferase [Roseomonas rosulenta]